VTINEIEVLLAMLEAVGASPVRATRLPVLPGSPLGTPEARTELEAAGKAELAFVHRELQRARQFASELCEPPIRDRLDPMTTMAAREARRGFDGLAYLLDEMGRDLEQDVPGFATWPGIAQAFQPSVKALLEAARYAPAIPRRATREDVERRIASELAGDNSKFCGWTHEWGADWLADQGLLFSSRSLKTLPIWLRAKAPECRVLPDKKIKARFAGKNHREVPGALPEALLG